MCRWNHILLCPNTKDSGRKRLLVGTAGSKGCFNLNLSWVFSFSVFPKVKLEEHQLGGQENECYGLDLPLTC